DQPPGRPVKFENAAVIAEIHDATIILSDRPVLEAGVVVGRRVVGDEGAADFVRSCLLCECGLPEKGQQKEQETGNRPCSTKTTSFHRRVARIRNGVPCRCARRKTDVLRLPRPRSRMRISGYPL